MEFKKLYQKTLDETHSKIENYIKTKLIESLNNDYGFNEASKEILEENEIKFKTNKFNTTPPYTDLIYIFNKRNKYSKNINENALKRDVKPVFDNLNIKGYSFEDLIKDLAEYYSETNTYRIFRNHYTLFDLIYKSEEFSEFKIEEFNSDEEYTKTLMKYKNLVFPQSKENNANLNFVEEMINQDNITNDIESNSPQNNKTKPLKENDNKIILTNEENCLLIFLFKKIISEKGFDTNAEIYKALSLIQVKQLHEFGRKDSYRSSNEYKVIGGKLNNINLNDIDKNNKQLKREYYKLLNKLSNKIKSQKMDKINKEITILTEYIEPQIK